MSQNESDDPVYLPKKPWSNVWEIILNLNNRVVEFSPKLQSSNQRYVLTN